MEADVIGATVANAFAQGCDRVYLVDNDSADATVAEAVSAGAQFRGVVLDREVRRTPSSRHHEPRGRGRVADSGAEHVWWLWLDADEFPHGPGGLTVREYLATLDRRYRIVGGRAS